MAASEIVTIGSEFDGARGLFGARGLITFDDTGEDPALEPDQACLPRSARSSSVTFDALACHVPGTFTAQPQHHVGHVETE
jgi:hypothetical protein